MTVVMICGGVGILLGLFTRPATWIPFWAGALFMAVLRGLPR